MGQEKLIYSFVARGTVILADYMEFQGNFSTAASKYLQKLPASNNMVAYNCDGYTFNYLVEDGYTYCVVAVESTRSQIVVAFLERVKEDFTKIYGGGKAAIATANSLDGVFSSKLKGHMQYCVDHLEEISKLAKVNAQVSGVKGVMEENIEKMGSKDQKIQQMPPRNFRGIKPRGNRWIVSMESSMYGKITVGPIDNKHETQQVRDMIAYKLGINKSCNPIYTLRELEETKAYSFCSMFSHEDFMKLITSKGFSDQYEAFCQNEKVLSSADFTRNNGSAEKGGAGSAEKGSAEKRSVDSGKNDSAEKGNAEKGSADQVKKGDISQPRTSEGLVEVARLVAGLVENVSAASARAKKLTSEALEASESAEKVALEAIDMSRSLLDVLLQMYEKTQESSIAPVDRNGVVEGDRAVSPPH